MKDLIITLAVDKGGKQMHRLQTSLLKASARYYGYTGDFLAVHNYPKPNFYVGSVGDTRSGQGQGDLEKFYDPNFGGRHRVQNIKMHLDEIVDLSKWDRVMFCDTDVLFFVSPSELFDASEVDVSFARERRHITAGPFCSCWSDSDMASFKKGSDKGINSGQFVVRNKKAAELWRVWRETLEKHWHRRSKLQDQSPFNHLIYFSNRFSVEEFPDGWVGFPYQSKRPNHHWNAKMIHYCGWASRGKMRMAFMDFAGALLVKDGGYEQLTKTFLGMLK